jgi:hypothetical protein
VKTDFFYDPYLNWDKNMPNIAIFPVYSLEAADGTKLTKTKDSSYPHISKFISTEHDINSMETFLSVIKHTAKTGGCLIKGFLNKPLRSESRAGSTSADDMTPWLCFDLDGADYKTPVAFIKDLPEEFKLATYIQQFSASAGDKPGLRCHLFFQLDGLVYAHQLKTYLQHLNLTIPTLRQGITLSKVGVALKWPLDITVCQNDKLIYIAPPEYKTSFTGQRIKIIKKRYQSVKIDFSTVIKARVDMQVKKLVNRLREEVGLPARRLDPVRIGNTPDVAKNPGASELTGLKEERGFNYINLNGGNSWGYFHKVGQNEILYNFKGEPNYLIKEILPEYYLTLSNSSSSLDEPPAPDTPSGTLEYFAILDPKTDKYSRGFYDPNTDTLNVHPTASKDKLHHFLKAHGLPKPDFIPEWRVKYDFDSKIQYDPTNKQLNLYKRTQYLKIAEAAGRPPVSSIPTNINKLLDHVFNYQADVKEHFINWLAFIIQHKKATRTAWVLHGTQGTGKGVLFNNIITPILGMKSSFRTTLPTLETEFNAFMEESLVVLLDETQVSELNKKSVAMSNLKQYITDPLIQIRRMFTDTYVVENRTNFFIFSNKYDPIQIDASDRRMNIAPRQEIPLIQVMTSQEIDDIQAELQLFTSYLNDYSVNATDVGSVFQSEERTRLQTLTQDSGEEVAERLRTGDLGFFIENAPDHEDTMQFEIKSGFAEDRGPMTYVQIIDLFIKHRGEHINVTRDEIRVLYYYINNLIWATPHKFSKYAGHKGLKIDTINVKGSTHRGIKGIIFQCDDDIAAEWKKKHARKSTSKTIRRIK